MRTLVDRPSWGYVLLPLAAPHHRREGLVYFWPSAGLASKALSRRRSRPTTTTMMTYKRLLTRRWRTALRRSHSADRSCGVRAPRRRARARQVSDGKRNPPCSRTPCRAHRKRTLGRCATDTTSEPFSRPPRQPRRKGTRSAAARRRHRGAYCCTTVTRRCTRSRRQHDRCTPSTRTKGSVGLRESSRVDGGPVGAGLDARGYRLR